jgi:hypothetical protein
MKIFLDVYQTILIFVLAEAFILNGRSKPSHLMAISVELVSVIGFYEKKVLLTLLCAAFRT